MIDSILDSVKKVLGIDSRYDVFDEDLIMHINSVFMILRQMGVGPASGFSIEDSTAVWSDYISDLSMLQMVRTYVALKVRMIFDPPTSSTLAEAINKNIAEMEWRLNAQVDPSSYDWQDEDQGGSSGSDKYSSYEDYDEDGNIVIYYDEV